MDLIDQVGVFLLILAAAARFKVDWHVAQMNRQRAIILQHELNHAKTIPAEEVKMPAEEQLAAHEEAPVNTDEKHAAIYGDEGIGAA